MAFKLNMRDPYGPAPRLQSPVSPILGARQQLRWSANFGYFESPKMHMMSAAFTFLLGLTVATLAARHLAPNSIYDMTPTGSISSGATHAHGARSCD